MNFKTTALLFGLLICTLWVFGLALQLQQGALDEGLVFPSLRSAKTTEVQAVEWVQGDKDNKRKYTLTKTDAGWAMKAENSSEVLRLDETKVKNLIDEVLKARKNEEADIPRDADKAGLKPPQGEVVLKFVNDRSSTLYVGKKTADEVNVFVQSSERPDQIFPVKKSSLDALFLKNIDEMRSRRLLEVTDETGRFIEVVEGGKTPKTVQLERGADNLWRFKQPSYGLADFEGKPSEKGAPGVRGLLNSAGGIRVENLDDFVTPGARKLEDFGLVRGKETYRIEVKRTGKEGSKDLVTEVLLVGNRIPAAPEKKDEKTEKKEEKEKDNKDHYYARLESDNFVVKIPAKSLDTVQEVLKDPSILRNRDLTLVEASGPDAVNIQMGPGLKEWIKLRKVDATVWKMFTPHGAFKANQAAIDATGALIDTVRGKGQIKEFFDSTTDEEAKKLDARLGLDQPTAEIALYINAVDKSAKKEEKKEEKKDTGKDTKKEEKKTGKEESKKDEKTSPPAVAEEAQLKKSVKPAVTVQFGRIERNLVYAKRIAEDGSVTRVSVPVSILDRVAPANGELAFLEDKLPPLPGTAVDAVKLELIRSGDKTVVERTKKTKDDKNLTWQFTDPKDSPIAPDDGEILKLVDRLSGLNVVKWVKRMTPNEDLDKFGLKSPAVKAEVTTRKKPEEKGETTTYSLSKEFELDKEKVVYALRSGTELIFQTSPAALKELQEAELRDRTVFKFEAPKVREVKLDGWKEAKKFQVTLDLKRKADGSPWEVSGLPGFKADDARVTKFVGDLAHLKAEKFVRLTGGPLPEQRLTPADAPLIATIKMDDGKEHKLIFGALNGDKTAYFAQSSSLPGVVFTLPKSTWETLLSGPEFFGPEQRAQK